MNKDDYSSARAIFSGLLPEQIQVLQRYDRDNVLNGLSPNTCVNKLNHMTLLSKNIQKPFDKITEEDVKKYILKLNEELQSSSLAMRKSTIKSFFKWYYKAEDYPDVVRWIKTGYTKSKHQLPENILTPSEVNILIDAAIKPQHKAMIAVLFDTGVRAGELAGMNLNDIEFDDNGGLIPQGGIVIGLALMIKQNHAFDEISDIIISVIIGATIIHELIGPIIAKISLIKAGEIKGEEI